MGSQRVRYNSVTDPFFTFFRLMEVVLGKGRTCDHLQTRTNLAGKPRWGLNSL